MLESTRRLSLQRFEDWDVKRPLYAYRKRVISWLISVIVDARSQLEHATRDKLEGSNDNVSRCEGSDFSQLMRSLAHLY